MKDVIKITVIVLLDQQWFHALNRAMKFNLKLKLRSLKKTDHFFSRKKALKIFCRKEQTLMFWFTQKNELHYSWGGEFRGR